MSSALVIVLWVLFTGCIGVHSESRWMPEAYESDVPRKVLVRHGVKVINSTSTQNGTQYSGITVTVTAFNEVHILDLSLNSRLFASNYTEKIITSKGEEHQDVNHTQSHCFYLGTVRNRTQSTAAINTCNGITGYYSIGNVSYHIESKSSQLRGNHVVYRNRPGVKSSYRCGSDHIVLETLMKSANARARVKRSFNWPQDEDKKDKVVELYIVNDYSQYQARGSDSAAVFQRAKEVANIASSAYQVLGIYLVLVGMEVWSESDRFPINPADVDSVLGNWYAYRRRNINPYQYNDNAVLITHKGFDKGVIGKATVGSMCSYQLSGAVISDISQSAAGAGSTMAHELGHNFGLAHDSDSCSCVDYGGRCIMYASSNLALPATNWSSCSTDQFSNAFQHGGDICLYDTPNSLFQPTISTCGNGIVETGEECDCGRATREECNSDCCNRTTCRLIEHATCASGRCCDVARCQIRNVGAQCRNKLDDCDLAEFCDGVQSLCPADTYKPDGTLCTVNQDSAYCYQGQCRSHSSQCELLWGSGTRSSDDVCYTYFNTAGAHYGNCGLNWLPNANASYIPCQQSDTMCGKLQCDGDSQMQLAYYQNYYLLSSASYGRDRCRSVIFDFGTRVQDPGLVPNGAKCGVGKMCVSQKCIEVSSLSQGSCEGNCLPDEVCNNLGQCQKNGSQVLSVATTTTTATTTATTTQSLTSSTTPSTTTSSTTSSTTSPTTSTTSTTPSTTTSSTTSSTTNPTTSTTSTTPSTTNPTTSTTSTTTSTTKTSGFTSPMISTTSAARNTNSGPSQSLNEGTFGVHLVKSQTGIISPLHLDDALANSRSRYNFSTNSFRSSLVTVSQFVYTEICAGVLGSTTAQLRTTGAYPPLSFDWMSTAQNGVDSGCRGGVLSVSNVLEISLGQNGGGVYSSSDQKETSWSMFSVTDTMKYASQLLCVFGARSYSDYGALPLLNTLVNPVSPVRLYNAATTAYTCASDASAYFFSMSVGVPAGRTAAVQLVISGVGYTLEMTRQNTRTTGTTTLARTVLVPCTSDARIVLIDGEVVPGSNLISFTAVPYELKTGTSVSWAGYRTRDVTIPGTITYDRWLVQEGINFQVENSIILIPVSGYYYVYVSAGVGQGKPVDLSVLLNNNSLFGVTRTATDHNGVDTIGHGMVVLLSVNDQLKVDIRTTAYSSSTGLHTSFIGMLLYQN